MPCIGKTREEILYAYVTKTNKLYAFFVGKKRFKTVSKYIDYLITKDRQIHEAKEK